MTEILQNVQVFAPPRRRRHQSYDNTSSFSSKTAELIRAVLENIKQIKQLKSEPQFHMAAKLCRNGSLNGTHFLINPCHA